MLLELLKLFFLYLVIFDPFVSLASFLSMTKSLDLKKRRSIVFMATLVAGALLAIFLFGGTAILDMVSISIFDFKIAGGVVLGILGIRMVLGQDIIQKSKKGDSVAAISTIIATPLISGPAAIMTTIVAASQYGFFITGLAILFALIVVFVILYFSDFFSRLFGKTAISIMSTLLGLVTLGWGVAFIRQGLAGI